MDNYKKLTIRLISGFILHIVSIVLALRFGIENLKQRNCHPKLPTLSISDVRLSNYVTKDLEIDYSEFYLDGYCYNPVAVESIINGSLIKTVKCLDGYLRNKSAILKNLNNTQNPNQTILNNVNNSVHSNVSNDDSLSNWQKPKLRNKYDQIYQKIVGSKSIKDSVHYGKGFEATKIWFLTYDPYAFFMISAYLRVFEGNVVSNFGRACKLNNLPLEISNFDRIVSTFCSLNISTNTTDSIRSISWSVQDLTPTEMQTSINVVTTCNMTEYLNALSEANVFGILFPSGKIKECYDLIPERPTISMLRKLKSMKAEVENLIHQIGLNFSSNWKEQVYDFLGTCQKEEIEIKCINEGIDDCSKVYRVYGVLTIIFLFIPGTLYGISEFCLYRYYRFGGLFGTCKFGDNLCLFLKCLILPVYVIVMGIMLNPLITIEYLKAIISSVILALQPDNETKNKDKSTKQSDLVSMQLSRIISLEALGMGQLQIILQIYFLLIMLLLGGGSRVYTIESDNFYNSTVPLAVTSIIIWTIHLIKLHCDSELLNVLRTRFSHTLSLKNLIIGCTWRFSAIISTSMSISLLLEFLWIHLSFREQFGNYNLDLQTITFSNFLTKLSNLEEHIEAKYYLYLIPFTLFLFPLIANVWAYIHDIGIENEFSIANAIVSCIFPTSFLHPLDKRKTGEFLFCNQMSNTGAHLLVWISYSLTELSLNNENYRSAFILRFVVPSIIPIVLICPFLSLIYWSTTIRKAYDNNNESNRACTEENSKRTKYPQFFIIAWYLFNGFVRMMSIFILFYVFFELIEALQPFYDEKIYIALIPVILQIIMLIIGNVAIQYLFLDGSLIQGFLAILGPTLFSIKGKFIQKSCNRCLRQYLWANILFNIATHSLLWFTLTFLVCWGVRSDTKEFVLGVKCVLSNETVAGKFYVYSPIVLCLHILSLPLALVVDKLALNTKSCKINPGKYKAK